MGTACRSRVSFTPSVLTAATSVCCAGIESVFERVMPMMLGDLIGHCWSQSYCDAAVLI